MDCSDYKQCATAPELVIYQPNLAMKEIIAFGCWGVYCQDGDVLVAKERDGALKIMKVLRGQRRVAAALRQYCQQHEIEDIYLAGDNVYHIGIELGKKQGKKDMDRYEQELKSYFVGRKMSAARAANFDIDQQLEVGFEQCFRDINVDRFWAAVGNHDVENCAILNTEKNYGGWIMPAMYYNVIYVIRDDVQINVIVIDTNMLEDEGVRCDGKKFTAEEIKAQFDWAEKVRRRGDWNIVIGHSPARSNGHKDKRPIISNKMVQKMVDLIKPQLYFCADEHNQQLIHDGSRRISYIVAGSGGADPDYMIAKSMPGTMYRQTAFGFVSLKFSANMLTTTFYRAEKNGQHKIDFEAQIDRTGRLIGALEI